MTRNLNLQGEFLTRVEGHGRLRVEIVDGALRRCQLQVVEAPRFFEAMLRGRSIFEAQHLSSRICGICACGHSLASLQAAEAALGVEVSSQTLKLRQLLLYMEVLDSHILHVALLVAPDLVGVGSFLGLLPRHEALVRGALRLKQACNEVCALLVGRHVHPIGCVIGGFTKLPGERELQRMERLVRDLGEELVPLVEFLAGCRFPAFSRETEYVALVAAGADYPLLAGDIGSSDGVRRPVAAYAAVIREEVVAAGTAKHARMSRDAYMVGALSRFNLNQAGLLPAARAVAEEFGLFPRCTNPYLIPAAQLVECVHCAATAQGLVEELLSIGIDGRETVVGGLNETGAVPLRAGSGVGAVEVPRGTLFHHYQVDEQGLIVQANCIIPTAQNLGNLEADLWQLVPQLLHAGEAELTPVLERLVRAYDPCISCSTHVIQVHQDPGIVPGVPGARQKNGAVLKNQR